MLARLAILLMLLLAGCGGDEPDEAAAPSTPTPNPTTAPDTTAEPSAPGSAANAFIGSLAVDPGDGTLMIGTGLGLYRLEPDAKKAERVTGKLDTPDGSGELSSNMVVRYSEPGDLLASGHPEGSGALPEDLGLIRSTDAGDTWKPVSELGESDFHLLQARGDHVVAVRAEDLIVGVDGVPVRGVDDLQRLMTEERIGTRCALAVVREGVERMLQLVPRELDAV